MMIMTTINQTKTNLQYASLIPTTKNVILTRTVIVLMALVVMRMAVVYLSNAVLRVFTEQMMMRQVAV